MPTTRRLVLDTLCEVHDLLRPYANEEFWDFANHAVIPGSLYVIGRRQLIDNKQKIIDLVNNNTIRVVFSNPHEGSDTLRHHCIWYGIDHLIKSDKILLIGGGDMDSDWPCLQYESFLPKLLDYDENIAATERSSEIYNTPDKPYKFLFLNGRQRSHRSALLTRFSKSGLLDHSLWTNLDSSTLPVHYLPAQYEVDRYQSQIDCPVAEKYVKYKLFNNDWGEIYLKPEAYIDTYFSLVTETVFEYPYSFRTEKIWKPVVMQQPWIAVANRGYYRDMHNLGFKTFNNIIDESWDLIDNNQDRLERIAQTVEQLCASDLVAFLAAAEEVCKYNFQHYVEMRSVVRKEFPDRFFHYITTHE